MEKGDLKFRVSNEEVIFNICKAMKQPKDLQGVRSLTMLANYDFQMTSLCYDIK